MTPDPMARFDAEIKRATPLESFDATRAALATSDPQGIPSVRFVLVKEHDHEGFVFYTNYESNKARDLEATRRGALVFH